MTTLCFGTKHCFELNLEKKGIITNGKLPSRLNKNIEPLQSLIQTATEHLQVLQSSILELHNMNIEIEIASVNIKHVTCEWQ